MCVYTRNTEVKYIHLYCHRVIFLVENVLQLHAFYPSKLNIIHIYTKLVQFDLTDDVPNTYNVFSIYGNSLMACVVEYDAIIKHPYRIVLGCTESLYTFCVLYGLLYFVFIWILCIWTIYENDVLFIPKDKALC